MRCVYCNDKLDKNNSSLEHIIPQAIGGLLESYEICCKKCNTKKGDGNDTHFVNIFNPITESYNIKTSRKKNQRPYKGVVSTF